MHIDHIDLLGKLKISTSTLVSLAENDYKCIFLRLITNDGSVLSFGANGNSIYDSTEI